MKRQFLKLFGLLITMILLVLACKKEEPMEDLMISKSEVSLEEGQKTTVKITAGSCKYEVSSSNTAKAKASIKDRVITINAIAEGFATITVKGKNKQTKTIKVTVTAKIPDLAIEKAEITVEAEQKATLEVKAGSGKYTVKSSDTAKATVSIKDNTITINGIAEGTADITIEDIKTKQTKTIKVTVTAKTPDLAIEKAEITLEAEQKAMVKITAGSGKYTVKSSDTAKATVSIKDNVITVNGIAEGTTDITIEDTKTKQTNTIKVTVTAKTPDLAIEKVEITVEAEQKATVEVKAGSGKYTVKSSDTAKATVSIKDGVITVKGIAEGIADITIEDTKTKQTKTIKVTVTAKTPDLAIENTEVTVEAEQKATVEVKAGSGKYTVKSSDTAKATVSIKDNVITVNGIAEGIADITIEDTKTKQTKTIKVTVTAKTPDLAIEKSKITLEEGKTATVKITAGSGNYTVSVSNSSKVTASESNGKITIEAKEEGVVIVTVEDTKTGQTKTIKVTITAKEVEAYIELTTAKAVGETIKLIIDAKEEDKADIWIDLNNNGTKDNGEAVTNFSPDSEEVEYTLGSQTIRVYGKVTFFGIYYGNKVVNLNVSKSLELKILGCYDNQLTSLDISKNIKLEVLVCAENQLKNLDISQNTKLQALDCSKNQINSLNVSQNVQLEELACNNNNLTSLYVSKNDKLKLLYCDYNQINSLNVSQNRQLEDLGCNNNNLTSLDVSKNDKLKYLDCDYNKLSNLDVSKNKELKKLDCSHNVLKSLNISQNPKLERLDCRDNVLLWCIKVSQEQLDNTEKRWRKDDIARYNTNCE